MVAVAQLVESRIVIPVVAGSSPVSHPKKFKQKAQSFGLGFLLCGLVQTFPEISFFTAKKFSSRPEQSVTLYRIFCPLQRSASVLQIGREKSAGHLRQGHSRER
jgi:hypothetical protein